MVAIGGGCAVNRAGSAPSAEIPIERGRAARVFDREGRPVSWAELVSAASTSDAVLVGELHHVTTSPQALGQAVEAALFADIAAATGRTPTAALEFFERDQQTALDDYLGRVTDEEAMKKASARGANGYPFGHRAIVEACRAAGAPVIAANAPRRYVRIARLEGYERLAKLTSEQRRLFRVPDRLPEDGYRDAFFKLMGAGEEDATTAGSKSPSAGGAAPGKPAGSHGDAAAAKADATRNAEAMFRSQSLWDWTMADSVASALGAGLPRPVVLIVGEFHVANDGGLVQALRQLRPGVRITTVSCVPKSGAEFANEHKGRADFVVHIGEESR